MSNHAFTKEVQLIMCFVHPALHGILMTVGIIVYQTEQVLFFFFINSELNEDHIGLTIITFYF